jgi:hypothetical protein
MFVWDRVSDPVIERSSIAFAGGGRLCASRLFFKLIVIALANAMEFCPQRVAEILLFPQNDKESREYYHADPLG